MFYHMPRELILNDGSDNQCWLELRLMQYNNTNTLLFSMVPTVRLAKNKINEIKSQYFRKEKVYWKRLSHEHVLWTGL